MNTKDSLKLGIDTSDMICSSYLGDLNDAEMMQRPHAECNHLNWQLGHLIVSENQMMQAVPGSNMPPLPTGMIEMYAKETQGIGDATKFMPKEVLMKVFKEQRAATLKALAEISEADLDKPTGISYAPTVGSIFSMQGSHWLMHAGQWVIVRRNLGKPVLI